MKKTKVQLEQELEMATVRLAMIHARLLALGCRHEGDHDATPPMIYDDWIACCVGKREDELAKLRASLVRIQLAVSNLLMADDLNSWPLPATIIHALKGLRMAYEKAKGGNND